LSKAFAAASTHIFIYYISIFSGGPFSCTAQQLGVITTVLYFWKDPSQGPPIFLLQSSLVE
jgi:hypothetical protein